MTTGDDGLLTVTTFSFYHGPMSVPELMYAPLHVFQGISLNTSVPLANRQSSLLYSTVSHA